MKSKIFNNWSVKLISFIIACLIWFVVAQIGDPQTTTTFSNVTVTLKNTELLEKENKMFEVIDNTDTVKVTIRAPRSVIKDLRATDIVAEADMSKLTDINTIAISYYVPKVSTDSITGDHDVVKLDIEERVTKWIRVQNHLDGEVSENYMVSTATFDQNQIEVSGPKSQVDKIGYALVEVDVTGATSNLYMNVEPQLLSADGEVLELQNVSTNVSYIHMSVEILAVKEVPIELTTMGVPADGYITTGVIECNPETVKIAGTATTLMGISKISIPEDALNITGETGDMTTVLSLKDYLPDGVKLADMSYNGRVSATVKIEAAAERTIRISDSNFEITNIPEGYTAEIYTEINEAGEKVKNAYEVHISGLKTSVNAIQASSLRGAMNLNDYFAENNITVQTGVYEVPVKFVFTENVSMDEEIIVKVVLSKVEEL